MSVVNVNWCETLSRLHEYVVPDLGVKFIDRELEFEKLIKHYCRGDAPWIHVITGPWGCGKTQFARAMTYALQFSSDYVVFYVNLSEEELDRVFYPTKPELQDLVIKLVIEVLGGTVLKLPTNLYRFVKYVVERLRVRGKIFLVIIDEITRSLDQYRVSIRDYVASLSLKIYDISNEYSCTFYPILLTSDQTATELFIRERGKNLSTHLLWNLPKEALTELLQLLNSPLDTAVVWYITGGNPREVLLLMREYRWELIPYIDARVRDVVSVIAEYIRDVGISIDEVIHQCRVAVENPDYLSYQRFWNYLLRYNVAMYVDARLHRLSTIDRCEWIGEDCAFQLPIYYWILRAIVDRRRLRVTARDVLEVLRSRTNIF
mgnify:CR=1 FL=1